MVVTHSHPFDKSSNDPFEKHDHTQTEICFFSSVNINLHLATPNSVIEIKLSDYSKIFVSTKILSEYSSSSLQIIPRGPPSRI